jgi:hypothetical protein
VGHRWRRIPGWLSAKAARAAAGAGSTQLRPAGHGRVEVSEGLSASLGEGVRSPSIGDSSARAMRSEDRMKFMYVVTTGTDDPTKASLPLHLAANGSVELGHDTSVLLAGDATEILFGDNLEQTQGIGVPPVRELIAKLRDHSVPVYV